MPSPDLGPGYVGRHLRLSFHDVHLPAPDQVVASPDHIRELLRFVAAWDRRDPLLIHCRAGIGRSTATAYVTACFTNPEADEHDLALALRRAALLARPNETLVGLADREMGRGGRMSAAIASTRRDLPWVDVDEGEPFRIPLAHA